MHKPTETFAQHFVTGPPPATFDELYSPRETMSLIHKSEKSYWKTRDRIEFCCYEDRLNKVMVITCKNIESGEAFRTIFLDLESLYFELEAKAQDSREALIRKNQKKLDVAALKKNAIDFILARLMIQKDPLPWPSFDEEGKIIVEEAAPITGAPIAPTEGEVTTALATPKPYKERMCTFAKLTNDAYNFLEIAKPEKLVLDSFDFIKSSPPVVVVEEPPVIAPTEVPAPVEEVAAAPAATTTTAPVPVAATDKSKPAPAAPANKKPAATTKSPAKNPPKINKGKVAPSG